MKDKLLTALYRRAEELKKHDVSSMILGLIEASRIIEEVYDKEETQDVQ